MKRLLPLTLLSLTLAGCASTGLQPKNATEQASTPAAPSSDCPGHAELPPELMGKLQPVDDATLLSAALGEPGKGGLCRGKTYEVKPGQEVTIYRAWNSTNPGSKMGSWWSFQLPRGAVAEYRSNYEICYQWSPLDMLVQCTMGAGQRIVLGNGQSATCSTYLSYPASSKQQVFIQNASSSSAVGSCSVKTAEFSWR